MMTDGMIEVGMQKAQWELRWHWKYTVNKEPYDEEAKEYLTRKALKLSEPRWQALEDPQREDLLSKELWVKENCEVTLIPQMCIHHVVFSTDMPCPAGRECH